MEPDDITKSIKSTVAKHGYAYIKNHRLGIDSISVAEAFGKTITPWADRRLQQLTPHAVAAPNTYSGIYGLQQFPFHTDLAHWRIPPRYLLLRCVTGFTNVPTLLTDGRALVDAVKPDVLVRAIFRPRRPKDGLLSLVRLCEPTDDGYLLRWDEVFLKPASRTGELANSTIREWLGQNQPLSIALSHPGDTLLIDNWRILHARSAIPIECKSRNIERVYLEALH